jgi:hypothetical protein
MTKNWNFDLLGLACQDSDLRKIGSYYIGPCPFCGGDDRFNLKVTTKIDLWICRQCGDGKYKNAIAYLMKRNGWTFGQTMRHIEGVDKDSIPNRSKAIAEEKASRKKILDSKLEEFTTQEIWEALHRRIVGDEHHRQWWRDQGVPDSWQDYLSLGWTPEKSYISSEDGKMHASSAYTIPYFTKGKKFVTMQYRMCGDQISPNDRYRFEYGLGTSFYMTTPTLPIGDKAIVCEGAKKGIVARTYTPSDSGITVLAVPSKSDFGGISDHLKQCDTVWIVLDPDALERAEVLAEQIGIKDTLVVETAVKLDDYFLSGALTPKNFHSILRQGVKVL